MPMETYPKERRGGMENLKESAEAFWSEDPEEVNGVGSLPPAARPNLGSASTTVRERSSV